MKIAICSPHYSAYSETFILAHKNFLKGNILYYNTGWVPKQLELKSILPSQKLYARLFRIILTKLNLLKYTDPQLGFYRSLKRERPNVILAEYAVCGAEIYEIAEKLKIPIVIICLGFDVSHKPTIVAYSERYIEAFSYANKVVGVSKLMCAKLVELGCPNEKIVYSCCGPNSKFFALHPLYDKPVALFVGRFVEKKAPYIALFAFSIALKKIPDAKLRMVGDGELFSVCKEIAKALKIEKSVTFLGSLTHDEMMMEMNSALFFVQHSKTSSDGDMEGTPVAILEAQAASLPVISTYHAGIPDVVIHNETGLLCEEGDIDEMANNMIKLFENTEFCKQLGKNARERVMQHFTLEQHIDLLQKLLNDSVKR